MSNIDLSSSNVLITGVAGFIGVHLAEYFLRQGASVTGVDNFITGQQANKDYLESIGQDKFKFFKRNLNEDELDFLETEKNYNFVFHFASPASPPKYQEFPRETYLVNSYATHRLLTKLYEQKFQGVFLFASTSEIYGSPLEHPQIEGYWANVNPNGIRSCYDEAKRLGETICGVYQRDFDMDVRIVRIFNTYGPKMDLGDGRVIPNFISSLLHHQPFSIYGDGMQTRSFCYIDDLVSGLFSFATIPEAKKETINLGNPNEMTILEVIETFKAVTSQHIEVEKRPLPGDDPLQRKPDISKAMKILNWSPVVSISDGLRSTIDYYRKSSLP